MEPLRIIDLFDGLSFLSNLGLSTAILSVKRTFFYLLSSELSDSGKKGVLLVKALHLGGRGLNMLPFFLK